MKWSLLIQRMMVDGQHLVIDDAKFKMAQAKCLQTMPFRQPRSWKMQKLNFYYHEG